MLEHDIDAQIVAQMDGSGLQQVLQSVPYQTGSVTQLNEGVNLLGLGQDPSAPQGMQQAHQQYVMAQNPQANPLVQQLAAPGGGFPGQTAGQPEIPFMGNQAQFSQADVERLRQIALQATQARVAADEAAFQAEIANLPEEERVLREAVRERDQAMQVNGWLNGRIQSIEQAQYQQQQQASKNAWGFIIATRSGLPYSNPAIKSALMAANSEAEMMQIAQGMVGLITGNQQQQVQQQLNSGVFAAGGNQAGGGQGQLQQFEGSGNLGALLNNRGYQSVSW